MSGTVARLPPGFVLDDPTPVNQAPGLPPGFTLDPAAPEPSFVDAALSTGRQFMRGATLGYGDEIASASAATVGSLVGRPGTWSDQYNAALANNRQRDKSFEAENPYLSLGAQVAGAVANPITRMSAGRSLLGRVLSNAGINATLGGVAGFGEGEGGFLPRLGSAGTGAATGAVLGAVVPAVGEGAATVAKKVAPYLGLNVARTDAQRRIIEALRSSGLSVDDVKTRLDPMTGQPMALADVGGEDLLGLAEYIARKPGPSMSAAREFVEQRGGLNQSGRLQTEISRAISSGDWKSTVDDLIATRARTAGPLYDAVRADPTPVNVQPIIADIDARIQTAKGPIRDALRRAKAQFLNANGAPDTTLGGLHETKIALDALMDRGGTKSIDNFSRREVREIQQRLIAEMDAASKGTYAHARDAFAGPSRAREAMDLGRSIVAGKDFDETADAIAKMTTSEKDFFRIGVSRALDDAVKGRLDTADLSKVRQLWGSQTVRERVAAAFDDPAEFKQFSEFMDNELTIALTNTAANPRAGSITQKVRMRDEQAPPMGPVFQALRNVTQGNTGAAMANLLPRAAPPGELKAETAAAIAPYLFSFRAGDRSRLLDELLRRQNSNAVIDPLVRGTGAALLRGGTVGSVQLQN